MAGHVFVIRGDLARLACDARLVPCDHRAEPSPNWFANSFVAEDRPWHFDDGVIGLPRKQPGPQPKAWICNVVAGKVEEVADRACRFLKAAKNEIENRKQKDPLFKRAKHLLALPVVGTGRGGQFPNAGRVIEALLPRLTAFAQQSDFDVVLVCREASMYAAAQAERNRMETAGKRIWPEELTVELRDEAEAIAKQARQGKLALFLGAGVSVPAGLPNWSELLEDLARGLKLSAEDEQKQFERLDSLDRATIIEQNLGTALGEKLTTLLDKKNHFALSHAMLASLPVREAITTNYDQLFEGIWGWPDSEEDICVLPTKRPMPNTRRWLLKMHGCLSNPKNIVLTRESYNEYDEKFPGLAGIVQAFLVTRHMLFVGFSLTDPNFHRIVHTVRRLIPKPDGNRNYVNEPRNEPRIGTALMLGNPGIVKNLWAHDLHHVWMDDRYPWNFAKEDYDKIRREAGRRQEIFLDHLLYKTRVTSHLLVGNRFLDLLRDDEKALCSALWDFVNAVKRHDEIRNTGAWKEIEQLLKNLGYDMKDDLEENIFVPLAEEKEMKLLNALWDLVDAIKKRDKVGIKERWPQIEPLLKDLGY